MRERNNSLKWIYIKSTNSSSSHSSSPQITVNEEVKSLVFGDKPSNSSNSNSNSNSAAVARDPCNVISIFGAARQGKSFLMNCLSGVTGLFTISNLSTPCTQGIDISRSLIPLRSFSEIDGGRICQSPNRDKIKIGFVDAEGQGDRDVTYDSVSSFIFYFILYFISYLFLISFIF